MGLRHSDTMILSRTQMCFQLAHAKMCTLVYSSVKMDYICSVLFLTTFSNFQRECRGYNAKLAEPINKDHTEYLIKMANKINKGIVKKICKTVLQ